MICFCEYTNQLTFDKERNFSSNRRCYYTIIDVMSFADHLRKSRVNFFDILFPCCLLLAWGVKLPSWTCMVKLFLFFFVYLICFRKFQITYILSFGLKTLKSKICYLTYFPESFNTYMKSNLILLCYLLLKYFAVSYCTRGSTWTSLQASVSNDAGMFLYVMIASQWQKNPFFLDRSCWRVSNHIHSLKSISLMTSC